MSNFDDLKDKRFFHKNNIDDIEIIVTEFFKLRFPIKNIQFEKDIGYFYTWANRFKNLEAWLFSDYESRRALLELHKKGFITLYEKIEID